MCCVHGCCICIWVGGCGDIANKKIYRMVEGWEQHGVLAVIFLAQMFCLQFCLVDDGRPIS